MFVFVACNTYVEFFRDAFSPARFMFVSHDLPHEKRCHNSSRLRAVLVDVVAASFEDGRTGNAKQETCTTDAVPGCLQQVDSFHISDARSLDTDNRKLQDLPRGNSTARSNSTSPQVMQGTTRLPSILYCQPS